MAGVATLLFSLTLMTPASASSTDSVQLSLTGTVDDNNPAGGSQIGIHPGDAINFSASAAPTAKAKSLADSIGLSSVLNGLLGSVKFQVVANFSGLPGGHSNTVVTESSKVHFSFSRIGKYSFSYQAQKVSVNLLGQKSITDINLTGNQAKQAGVELNASNQYESTIVVAKNPPAGGISVQLPSVSLHPKVAGQQLPKIKLPGVKLPTVRIPVPNLNPVKDKITGKTTKGSTGKNSAQTANTANTPITEKNQLLPVPARVFGAGTTGGSAASGGGGGGFAANGLQGSSPLGNGQQLSLGKAGASSSSGSNPVDAQAAQSKQAAKDLAANRPPSSQLPVVLAILAVIALALVAATYARLFLLRRAT